MGRLGGFSDAMNQAKAELKQQGFCQSEQISEQIMKIRLTFIKNH